MDRFTALFTVLLNPGWGFKEKILGYGTKFGTELVQDSGKVIGKTLNRGTDLIAFYLTLFWKHKSWARNLQFNSTMLPGLGAPPGFLSGDNEAVILEVFTRYTRHTEAVSILTTLSRYKLYLALAGDGDTDTADTEPSCEEECPEGSHCSWGVCFCDAGQCKAQLRNIFLITLSCRHISG